MPVAVHHDDVGSEKRQDHHAGRYDESAVETEPSVGKLDRLAQRDNVRIVGEDADPQIFMGHAMLARSNRGLDHPRPDFRRSKGSGRWKVGWAFQNPENSAAWR